MGHNWTNDNRILSMSPRPITSPEDQSATFIELFFDLVFVYSVTQVVGVLHAGFDLVHVGRAALVFWLVWWAWTQLTWALNAADTTHPAVELGVLLATAVAFFMAVAVPDAFGNRAVAFAIPYVLVRIIGLTLYAWVAAGDPAQRTAVRTFSLVSLSGLVAVTIGGFTGGAVQYWLWGLAIVLDITAAGVGGNMEGWNIHPEHFGERHGLFAIIALGESLIVAAGGLAGAEWNWNLLAVVVLSVAVTCALWWSYFSRSKPALDHALESRSGAAQSCMARDAFSIVHFFVVCGIIGFAAALEEFILHPDETLGVGPRTALGVSIVLFMGGMVVALWRATGRVRTTRSVVSLATMLAVVVPGGLSPAAALLIVLIGVVMVVLAEERVQTSSPFDAQRVTLDEA
jgi:low temperature requirement protein LtrA